MARIGAELREMTPAILATQPAPADVKVVGARWMATCDGKTLWVLVANPDARVMEMRLTVPSGLKTVKTLDGRAVTVRNGQVKEDLKPLACETYVGEMP